MMNVVSATVMAVAGEYVCMHADFASQIEVNSPRKDTRSTRAVNLI